jgi:hypothetical protein
LEISQKKAFKVIVFVFFKDYLDGTASFHKVIKKLTVGSNSISAPFPGVTSPKKDYPITYPW